MSNIETPQPDIAALRQAANENPQLKEGLSAAQREIAFLQAGVNTGTTFGKVVMANHDGDVTPDAIKATVERLQGELGIQPEGTPPPPPPPEPGAPGTPEAQLAAAAAGLHGGAPAGTPPPIVESSWDTAKGIYDQVRLEGLGQDAAAEAGIGSLIRSAQLGNPDVVWDADKWAEQQRAHGHGAEYASLPDAPRPEHV